jgi:hypothetical protein
MKKEYDFSRAKRGPVVKPRPGKTRITIRLDQDILEWFWRRVDEAGGGNYQTMINDVLRQFIASETEGLEETVRRVVREEISRSSRSARGRSSGVAARQRRAQRGAASGG